MGTKKKQKKTTKKNRANISPMKPLNLYEKNIFEKYKRAVNEEDETLSLLTLDRLEVLEVEYIQIMTEGLNEVVNHLNNEFIRIVNSNATSRDKIIEYANLSFLTKNLDSFYTTKLKSLKSSIDKFTAEKGCENSIRIDSNRGLIESASSVNLVNHASLYANSYHNNALRLLNSLINDLFENFKMESVEYLQKVEIVLFKNLAIISSDSEKLKNSFNKIVQILNENENLNRIRRILQELDCIGFDNLIANSQTIEAELSGDNDKNKHSALEVYQKEKHYDFKELEEIALNNGYKLDRIKGDHYIYKNIDKKHSVPIPCRKIGKGLSLAIKKELLKKNS